VAIVYYVSDSDIDIDIDIDTLLLDAKEALYLNLLEN